MKIIITVSGTELDSEVDPRFGRTPYFLLYDTDSGEATHINNEQSLNLSGGAGIQSAEIVARQGAEVLLTGHCGPKAFRTLKSAGIKIVVGVEGTAREAIEKYQKGEYEIADSPDVESHW